MLNEITLMGRLTQTPEIKSTMNGDTLVNMCLACDRDTKNSSGKYDTDFIYCTAWGNTAEFASRYFKKGQLAIVNGRLKIRKYTDKNGQIRVSPEIQVNKMYFAGDSRNESNHDQPDEHQKQEDDRSDDFRTIDDTDDLPF